MLDNALDLLPLSLRARVSPTCPTVPPRDGILPLATASLRDLASSLLRCPLVLLANPLSSALVLSVPRLALSLPRSFLSVIETTASQLAEMLPLALRTHLPHLSSLSRPLLKLCKHLPALWRRLRGAVVSCRLFPLPHPNLLFL
jgi:hypothetical protein